MKTRILCVEDDKVMQSMIAMSLQEFSLAVAASLSEAEKALRSQEFDALVLDISLPDGDGLKFWSKLRNEARFASVPVIFLTGETEISKKIQAFSAGAEDFITKPFDPLELRARLTRRLQSKSNGKKDETVRRIEDLEIDLNRQCVIHHTGLGARDLALTTIELKILTLLSKQMDQVFSREQLLEQVWSSSHVSSRTVDSHIAHLRSKIADSGVEIQTVKNMGYRLSRKSPAR